MGYFLGIDVGASRTVAAVTRPGAGDVEIVDLGDGDGVASVLHLGADGTLAVGADAERWSAVEPDRVVRGFPGRIGDGEAMLLAGEPWAPEELTAWLVRWVVDRVAEREAGPAAAVGVTHPVSGDADRTGLLAAAVAEQDLDVTFPAPPRAVGPRTGEAADGAVPDGPTPDGAARAIAAALRAADGAGSTVQDSPSGRHSVVGGAIAALTTDPLTAGPAESTPGRPDAPHRDVEPPGAADSGRSRSVTDDRGPEQPDTGPVAPVGEGPWPADDSPAGALDDEARDDGTPATGIRDRGAPEDGTPEATTPDDRTPEEEPSGDGMVGRGTAGPADIDDGGGVRPHGWEVPAPRTSLSGGHPAGPVATGLVADLVGFGGTMGATNTAGLLSGYTPAHGTAAAWSGGHPAAGHTATATASGSAVALPAQRSGSGRWPGVVPGGLREPVQEQAPEQALAAPTARSPTLLVSAGGLAAAVAVVGTLFLWPAPRTTNSATTRPVPAVPAAVAPVDPTPSVTAPPAPSAEPTPTRARSTPARTRRPAVPPSPAPESPAPQPTGSAEPSEPTTAQVSSETAPPSAEADDD